MQNLVTTRSLQKDAFDDWRVTRRQTFISFVQSVSFPLTESDHRLTACWQLCF